MKKLLNSLTLLVAVGALSTLAGCELYFGNGGSGDGSSGGGAGGGGGGGAGSGYECTSNTDCSSGCYCAPDGTCTEGGFCTDNSDCGSGYFCDTQRSSCEPNPPTPPPTSCNYDNQCPEGQYCSPATNTCTATCTCTDDQMAIDQGFGWCDETRSTCLPGQDPAGSCGGAITCTTAMPTCPSGQIALSIDGCWTGTCQVLDSCDVTPGCSRINDESDCLLRTSDCSASYTGLDCTKADGTACVSGDTGCVCASFQFATCVNKTGPTGRMVQDAHGRMLDASQLMLH